MRNMDAKIALRNELSRKVKGRESTMVVTSTLSAVVTCLHCNTPGHRFQNGFERKGTMTGKQPNPTPLNHSRCSLHNADLHSNKIATVGLKCGTATNPVAVVPVYNTSGTATTEVLTPTPPQLQPQQLKWNLTSQCLHSLLRLGLQRLLLRPWRPLPVHPHLQVHIYCSFLAAPPVNITAQPDEFSMAADSRASSHFIDH